MEEEQPKKRGRPKKPAVTKIAEVAVKKAGSVTPKPEEKHANQTESGKKPKSERVIWLSGRRKTAVARIKLQKGKGSLTINDKAYQEYFPTDLEQQAILSPFRATGRNFREFDISLKVQGGGKKAQLGACVLGLSKALVEVEGKLRPTLKKGGFLTRDSRMKERKKYGLKRARRAPQFSKR